MNQSVPTPAAGPQEPAYHIPALFMQSMEGLDIQPGGTYVDVTFGGGGHSRGILERLGPEGHLYAFDQDRDAFANAPHNGRLTLIWANFRYLTNFMRYYNVAAVDGLLADLGVSFHHFDDTERGFTFRDALAPLDMRMNRQASLTAAHILNTYTPEALTALLRNYGELKNAHALARRIEAARQAQPLETAGDLLAAVDPLISRQKQKKEMAQIFQALRIEVNGEMEALAQLLASALEVLRPGGRMAIITYHSLEDRLVKNFMRTGNLEGREDKDFYGHLNTPLKLLTAKPITPSPQEVEANPRARSAKLRIAQKL